MDFVAFLRAYLLVQLALVPVLCELQALDATYETTQVGFLHHSGSIANHAADTATASHGGYLALRIQVTFDQPIYLDKVPISQLLAQSDAQHNVLEKERHIEYDHPSVVNDHHSPSPSEMAQQRIADSFRGLTRLRCGNHVYASHPSHERLFERGDYTSEHRFHGIDQEPYLMSYFPTIGTETESSFDDKVFSGSTTKQSENLYYATMLLPLSSKFFSTSVSAKYFDECAIEFLYSDDQDWILAKNLTNFAGEAFHGIVPLRKTFSPSSSAFRSITDSLVQHPSLINGGATTTILSHSNQYAVNLHETLEAQFLLDPSDYSPVPTMDGQLYSFLEVTESVKSMDQIQAGQVFEPITDPIVNVLVPLLISIAVNAIKDIIIEMAGKAMAPALVSPLAEGINEVIFPPQTPPPPPPPPPKEDVPEETPDDEKPSPDTSPDDPDSDKDSPNKGAPNSLPDSNDDDGDNDSNSLNPSEAMMNKLGNLEIPITEEQMHDAALAAAEPGAPGAPYRYPLDTTEIPSEDQLWRRWDIALSGTITVEDIERELTANFKFCEMLHPREYHGLTLYYELDATADNMLKTYDLNGVDGIQRIDTEWYVDTTRLIRITQQLQDRFEVEHQDRPYNADARTENYKYYATFPVTLWKDMDKNEDGSVDGKEGEKWLLWITMGQQKNGGARSPYVVDCLHKVASGSAAKLIEESDGCQSGTATDGYMQQAEFDPLFFDKWVFLADKILRDCMDEEVMAIGHSSLAGKEPDWIDPRTAWNKELQEKVIAQQTAEMSYDLEQAPAPVDTQPEPLIPTGPEEAEFLWTEFNTDCVLDLFHEGRGGIDSDDGDGDGDDGDDIKDKGSCEDKENMVLSDEEEREQLKLDSYLSYDELLNALTQLTSPIDGLDPTSAAALNSCLDPQIGPQSDTIYKLLNINGVEHVQKGEFLADYMRIPLTAQSIVRECFIHIETDTSVIPMTVIAVQKWWRFFTGGYTRIGVDLTYDHVLEKLYWILDSAAADVSPLEEQYHEELYQCLYIAQPELATSILDLADTDGEEGIQWPEFLDKADGIQGLIRACSNACQSDKTKAHELSAAMQKMNASPGLDSNLDDLGTSQVLNFLSVDTDENLLISIPELEVALAILVRDSVENVCSDYQAEASCNDEESCIWNSDSLVCEEDSTAMTCFTYEDQPSCDADDSCHWSPDNSICTENWQDWQLRDTAVASECAIEKISFSAASLSATMNTDLEPDISQWEYDGSCITESANAIVSECLTLLTKEKKEIEELFIDIDYDRNHTAEVPEVQRALTEIARDECSDRVGDDEGINIIMECIQKKIRPAAIVINELIGVDATPGIQLIEYMEYPYEVERVGKSLCDVCEDITEDEREDAKTAFEKISDDDLVITLPDIVHWYKRLLKQKEQSGPKDQYTDDIHNCTLLKMNSWGLEYAISPLDTKVIDQQLQLVEFFVNPGIVNTSFVALYESCQFAGQDTAGDCKAFDIDNNTIVTRSEVETWFQQQSASLFGSQSICVFQGSPASVLSLFLAHFPEPPVAEINEEECDPVAITDAYNALVVSCRDEDLEKWNACDFNEDSTVISSELERCWKSYLDDAISISTVPGFSIIAECVRELIPDAAVDVVLELQGQPPKNFNPQKIEEYNMTTHERNLYKAGLAAGVQHIEFQQSPGRFNERAKELVESCEKKHPNPQQEVQERQRQDWFNRYDTNRDGTVTCQELRQLFLAWNDEAEIELTPSEPGQAVYASCVRARIGHAECAAAEDLNINIESGVQNDEFSLDPNLFDDTAQRVEAQCKMEDPEPLKDLEIFHKYDLDHDRTVTVHEIAVALQTMLDEGIKSDTTPGYGILACCFGKAIYPAAEKIIHELELDWPPDLQTHELGVPDEQKLFSLMDDIVRRCRELHPQPIKELGAIIHTYDSDHDGILTVPEISTGLSLRLKRAKSSHSSASFRAISSCIAGGIPRASVNIAAELLGVDRSSISISSKDKSNLPTTTHLRHSPCVPAEHYERLFRRCKSRYANGSPLSPNALWTRYDLNGDGTITRDEMIHTLQAILHLRQDVGPSAMASSTRAEGEHDAIHSYWPGSDTDMMSKGERIDREQEIDCIREMIPSVVDSLFNQIDLDTFPGIQREEWTTAEDVESHDVAEGQGMLLQLNTPCEGGVEHDDMTPVETCHSTLQLGSSKTLMRFQQATTDEREQNTIDIVEAALTSLQQYCDAGLHVFSGLKDNNYQKYYHGTPHRLGLTLPQDSESNFYLLELFGSVEGTWQQNQVPDEQQGQDVTPSRKILSVAQLSAMETDSVAVVRKAQDDLVSSSSTTVSRVSTKLRTQQLALRELDPLIDIVARDPALKQKLSQEIKRLHYSGYSEDSAGHGALLKVLSDSRVANIFHTERAQLSLMQRNSGAEIAANAKAPAKPKDPVAALMMKLPKLLIDLIKLIPCIIKWILSGAIFLGKPMECGKGGGGGKGGGDGKPPALPPLPGGFPKALGGTGKPTEPAPVSGSLPGDDPEMKPPPAGWVCACYFARYPDLVEAYGDDCDKALTHWHTYGEIEGRSCDCEEPTGWDPECYLNKYADLKAAFGDDYTLALQHWYEFGIKEGRDYHCFGGGDARGGGGSGREGGDGGGDQPDGDRDSRENPSTQDDQADGTSTSDSGFAATRPHHCDIHDYDCQWKRPKDAPIVPDSLDNYNKHYHRGGNVDSYPPSIPHFEVGPDGKIRPEGFDQNGENSDGSNGSKNDNNNDSGNSNEGVNGNGTDGLGDGNSNQQAQPGTEAAASQQAERDAYAQSQGFDNASDMETAMADATSPKSLAKMGMAAMAAVGGGGPCKTNLFRAIAQAVGKAAAAGPGPLAKATGSLIKALEEGDMGKAQLAAGGAGLGFLAAVLAAFKNCEGKGINPLVVAAVGAAGAVAANAAVAKSLLQHRSRATSTMALDTAQAVVVGAELVAQAQAEAELDIANQVSATYLPPSPSSSIKKKSLLGDFEGYCVDPSTCTGGVMNGVCPGSLKLCVAETTPANPKKEWVTVDALLKFFEAIKKPRAEALVCYFNEAMDTIMAGVPAGKECARMSAFIAQVGHESMGFRYFEELASGAAYEGRSDLGNTQAGDGKRFKGRGPIQLTGRYNYQKCKDSIGIDIVAKPETVCMPSVGFKSTVWFWMSNGLNRYADSGDFNTLTRRINGGTNGMADRQRRFAQAKSVCPSLLSNAPDGFCGASSPSSTPASPPSSSSTSSPASSASSPSSSSSSSSTSSASPSSSSSSSSSSSTSSASPSSSSSSSSSSSTSSASSSSSSSPSSSSTSSSTSSASAAESGGSKPAGSTADVGGMIGKVAAAGMKGGPGAAAKAALDMIPKLPGFPKEAAAVVGIIKKILAKVMKPKPPPKGGAKKPAPKKPPGETAKLAASALQAMLGLAKPGASGKPAAIALAGAKAALSAAAKGGDGKAVISAGVNAALKAAGGSGKAATFLQPQAAAAKTTGGKDPAQVLAPVIKAAIDALMKPKPKPKPGAGPPELPPDKDDSMLVQRLTNSIAPKVAVDLEKSLELGMADNLKYAINRTVSRSLSKQMITDMTKSITSSLSKSIQSGVGLGTFEEATRIMTHTLIPALTLSLAPIITRATSRRPQSDYYCYFCVHKKLYCSYCVHSLNHDRHVDYYTLHYSRLYSIYYGNWYSKVAIPDDFLKYDSRMTAKPPAEEKKKHPKVYYGSKSWGGTKNEWPADEFNNN